MDWTADLAYVVGLITTDGCLSGDGRHIDLTSKDLEQIETFRRILHLESNKIGIKSSGFSDRSYYRIQFSHIKLYKFLISIGLSPAKSKTLRELDIPDTYFRDFLRGHLDGDGYTNSYFDPRWKNSFRLYTSFISASGTHLRWLERKVLEVYNISGRLRYQKDNRKNIRGNGMYTLRYAKWASVKLLNILYYRSDLSCLSRKRFKIESALGIISEQAGMSKLVNELP